MAKTKHKQRRPKTKLNVYFACHMRACFASLGRMVRASFANFITILVIAIALTLPLTFYVATKNVSLVTQDWSSASTQITIYLKADLTRIQTQDVLHELRANTNIANVRYISPTRGLNQFAKVLGSSEITHLLRCNPLPGVVILQPILSLRNPAQLQQLANRLQEMSSVDIAQLDMQWLQRLDGIINLANSAVFILALLLGFGVLLIIGNTIRLATRDEHREIAVFKLVGATNAFIRRPFLYIGIWYGFFSGVIAWVLVSVIIDWLQAPVSSLASSYGGRFILQGLSFDAGLSLVLISMFLGLMGAWITVNRSLKAHY
ncbi:MAG: permease-like cell division protein FtsX [Gammaproteobacteria bacterium]|nr:permease-like cell division protein FtsX [Gammaproteobacteria bacterium]